RGRGGRHGRGAARARPRLRRRVARRVASAALSGSRRSGAGSSSACGGDVMASVSFDAVTKRFGQTVAVDELTLDVDDGEFLILVGPSGCGTTTALRMVAGLEEITSGEVRIGDRVVNELAPTERDIAMVFQNYALYPHMSVADNIAFPLRQQKIKKQEART